MTTIDYKPMPGGRILMPVQGPPDDRPKKIKVPIRNGVAFPDGAIIMWSGAIGKSREDAEQFFRERGEEVEFVEVAAK